MSEHPSRRQLLRLLGLFAAASAATAGGAALAQPAPAALPPELATELPGARLQGSHRARFFGFHLYDIRLWVGERAATASRWDDLPLALELVYARKLVGAKIAERSLEEMRRQGEIAPAEAARWLKAMEAAFPDVGPGDRLTGVHQPGRAARFFFNGTARSELREAEFARRFFGIWLAPQTSEPSLRDALLAGTR